MRISDWSSDVCSSDLGGGRDASRRQGSVIDPGISSQGTRGPFAIAPSQAGEGSVGLMRRFPLIATLIVALAVAAMIGLGVWQLQRMTWKDGLLNSYRSEEHTSELQSLMRISYAVFCLKKKKKLQLSPYH